MDEKGRRPGGGGGADDGAKAVCPCLSEYPPGMMNEGMKWGVIFRQSREVGQTTVYCMCMCQLL